MGLGKWVPEKAQERGLRPQHFPPCMRPRRLSVHSLTLGTLRRQGANSRGQESNMRVKEGHRGSLCASLPPPSSCSLSLSFPLSLSLSLSLSVSLCLSLSLSHTHTHTQQMRRLPERSGHIIIGKMLVMFFSLPGSFQLF